MVLGLVIFVLGKGLFSVYVMIIFKNIIFYINKFFVSK